LRRALHLHSAAYRENVAIHHDEADAADEQEASVQLGKDAESNVLGFLLKPIHQWKKAGAD